MSNLRNVNHPYNERGHSVEGVLGSDDKFGYTRWWYSRTIYVHQDPDLMNKNWREPILSIKSINLPGDKINTYFQCLECATGHITNLQQRTGLPIEGNETLDRNIGLQGMEKTRENEGSKTSK